MFVLRSGISPTLLTLQYILGGTPHDLDITPRIVVVHDDMREPRIVHVVSDPPSVFFKLLRGLLKSVRQSLLHWPAYRFSTALGGDDLCSPFRSALAAVST